MNITHTLFLSLTRTVTSLTYWRPISHTQFNLTY